MFIAFIKGLVRLFAAVRAAKKATKVLPVERPTEYKPFRFSLEEMRCPICGRQPHRGLTKQLSERARSEGMIGCVLHGPVKGEILLSLPRSEESQAA